MLAAPITVARFIFNIESVVHDGVSVGNSWQKETGSSCEYRTAKLNKRYYIQIRGAPTQTQEQTKEIYNTIKGTIGELQDLEPIHEAYHSPPLTHPEPIAHKERATGILIDTLTSSYAQAVIGIVTGCALLVASPFFTGIPITFFYIITALTTCITIFFRFRPFIVSTSWFWLPYGHAHNYQHMGCCRTFHRATIHSRTACYARSSTDDARILPP